MNEQRRGNAGERPHRNGNPNGNGGNGAAQLQWHIPPRFQGQIIEVAFASDGEHIYRRAIDLGGRTGRVERTPYPACVTTRAECNPSCGEALPEACTVHDDGRYLGEARAFAEWLEEGGCKVALFEGQRIARPGGDWIAPDGLDEAPAWAWDRYCGEEPPPPVCARCGELGETPFTFEPWSDPPELELAEWEPVELESDGATWQPGGFERLDLDGYGALVMTPDDAPASGECCWLCHPDCVPATHAGVLCADHYATHGGPGGFGRLADGAWVRLGSTPERLDAPPIAYARDWPGARATLATVELGCECGCACDGAALELRGGAWLCADCAAGEHATCPHCGQRAELRTCERCERSAWVVDCGHYAQPRPIAADEHGRALCEVCAAPPRRWQAWWYAPDDGQAVALDGGTYECATAAEAQALSEAEARRAVAELQLRIMPTVRVEALDRCGR